MMKHYDERKQLQVLLMTSKYLTIHFGLKFLKTCSVSKTNVKANFSYVSKPTRRTASLGRKSFYFNKLLQKKCGVKSKWVTLNPEASQKERKSMNMSREYENPLNQLVSLIPNAKSELLIKPIKIPQQQQQQHKYQH
uniref:Uncharacterized protein n=1 Tax=Glossina austeni TaxID=7395 RepID=A0A1A9VKT6_GLOAU